MSATRQTVGEMVAAKGLTWAEWKGLTYSERAALVTDTPAVPNILDLPVDQRLAALHAQLSQ